MKQTNLSKNVALVLSSGGARGLAHIGAIEELEKQGFKIKSVAGSSMGALVGGFYAAGKLAEYKEWACNLNKMQFFKMLDFTLNKGGIIKGEKVFRELLTFIPNLKIENLPIPFTAIAADIRSKSEKIFTTGSLFRAIRASSSIPSVFTPVKTDGELFIDGSVLNPLPLNRVQRSENDILVAVDVNSFHENDTEKEVDYGYFDIVNEATSLMVQRITELTVEKYKPDILIEISRYRHGSYDFYHAEKIIEAGRQAAIESLMC